MKKYISISCALLGALVFVSCENTSPSDFPDWALVGFQRPEGINPVISPDTTSKFFCPMRKTVVSWEESDTFNPAATIIDGKVVVLYRAEDNSAKGIGSRTSRVGYASSKDGLHFEKLPEPVMYPMEDSQMGNESRADARMHASQ